MRQEQIINQRVKDSFMKNGVVPPRDTINVSKENMYKSDVNLLLPKKGSISNIDAHNSTITSLFKEYSRILEDTQILPDRILMQASAVESESGKLTEQIRTGHLTIVRNTENAEITDILNPTIPAPFKADGCRYDGTVSLQKAGTSEVNVQTAKVKAYYHGQLLDYTPVNLSSMPVDIKVKADNRMTGVQIDLTFAKQRITSLEIETSPVIIKVVTIEGNNEHILFKKHLTGRTSLILDNVFTDKLRLYLYTYQKESLIHIDNLRILNTLTVQDGNYISMPIPLSTSGIISVKADIFTPQASKAELYLSADTKIQGQYYCDNNNNKEIPVDPLKDELPGMLKYNRDASGSTPLSTIVKNYNIPGAPDTSFQWKPVLNENTFLYNCKQKQVVTFLTGVTSGYDAHIYSLTPEFMSESISIKAGSGVWVFIPHALDYNMTDAEIDQFNLNLYDRWSTYLILTEDTNQVDIKNISGKIKDISVIPVEVQDYNPTKIESHHNKITNTFSGNLPKGIYQIHLYVEAIDPNDLQILSAVQATDVVPKIEHPASGQVHLYPWPAVHTSIPFENLNPASCHKFFNLSGNKIMVPKLQNNHTVDYYHPDINLSTVYANPTDLAAIYDITYIYEDKTSEYVFLKLNMQASDSAKTPILRSVSIILNSLRNKKDAQPL